MVGDRLMATDSDDSDDSNSRVETVILAALAAAWLTQMAIQLWMY